MASYYQLQCSALSPQLQFMFLEGEGATLMGKVYMCYFI